MKYYMFFVFVLAGTVSACCNYLARIFHAEDVSHLAALGMLSVTSYTLHKNYTFRKKVVRREVA